MFNKFFYLIGILICCFSLFAEDFRIIDPIPEEYSHITLGTPVNEYTNDLMIDNPAFKLSNLAAEGLLNPSSSIPERRLFAGNAFSKQSQDAWGISTSMSVGWNAFYSKGSVKASANYAKNFCSASGGIGLNCYAEISTDIILNKMTFAEAYKCGSGLFKEKLKAVADASSDINGKSQEEAIAKLAAAISNFYDSFGTGCVTKIKLKSIGVFNGTLTSDSKVIEEEIGVGGSFSIGGTAVSASAAAEWAKNNGQASANASIRGESFINPSGSAVSNWIEFCQNEFQSKSLQKLFDTSSGDTIFKKAFTKPITESPKIEFIAEKPKESQIPNFTPLNFDDAIKKAKYLSEEEEWRKNNPGKEPTAEDIEKWAEKILNEVSSTSVASIINPLATTAAPKMTTKKTVKKSVFQNEDLNTPWLGKYCVMEYETTPWSEIIPELKSLKYITMSNLSVLKVYGWISSRYQIASYLRYCSFFEKYLNFEQNELSVNSSIFLKALNETCNEILNSKTKELVFTADTASSLENIFVQKLKNKNFTIINEYSWLLSNFDLVYNAPFGFIPLAYDDFGTQQVYLPCENEFYDPKTGVMKTCYSIYPDFYAKKINDLNTSLYLTSKRVRLYPIINKRNDNEIGFTLFSVQYNEESKKNEFATLVPMNKDSGNILIKSYDSEITKNGLDIWNLKSFKIEPFLTSTNENFWGKKEKGQGIYFKWYCNSTWEQNSVRLIFLPVTYQDVGDITNVGMPMWPESDLENIVNAIHNLGTKTIKNSQSEPLEI